ncbi:hypothetical protein PC116_g6595 [Phytophthora cactorum]|nr:hypothetical protein PC114_g7648 [Phytophthora cactorum]KAG4058069.1 hypothetical protein PC123_g6943 [Phytophthora cactorum]KAG4245623.1 hypothetical protein PC116_g6595 [Phytophthora cactorum]
MNRSDGRPLSFRSADALASSSNGDRRVGVSRNESIVGTESCREAVSDRSRTFVMERLDPALLDLDPVARESALGHHLPPRPNRSSAGRRRNPIR